MHKKDLATTNPQNFNTLQTSLHAHGRFTKPCNNCQRCYIYTVQVSHKFNTTHLEHACDMHVTCTTKRNTTQGHAMIHVYDLMSVLMLLVI